MYENKGVKREKLFMVLEVFLLELSFVFLNDFYIN